jgi:catechol 2,3-dioxygenase-like lactoylglutathione lyase family enzyme
MAGSFQSTREVILRTEKWADAVAFYRNVLDLPVAYETANMVGFETGAFRLYIEQGAAHPPVFELLAPDVETAKQELLAAGCTVIEEDPSLPRCYLRDPHGFTFNLAPAPVAQ